MKKLVLWFLISASLIACTSENKNASAGSDKLKVYEKNVETAKQFIDAFAKDDSTTLFSDKFVSSDFFWSPPAVGQDSLSREVWVGAEKGFMKVYKNKVLTNARYFAGLDSLNQPNGDVRVYGTWNSNFAANGKKSKLKWYCVLNFNEEGKITGQAEWYNVADISKEFD